jgi:hypothetical protein
MHGSGDPPLSSDKTFILGLGAQKCGTTWLKRYLSGSPRFARGITKEYHIWDTLHVPQIRPRGDTPRREPEDVTALRQAMLADPTRYFDYFSGLMTKPGKSLCADISPTYGALSAEVLTGISRSFADRGIATRAIFLMRDPVERCWSAARATAKRGPPPVASGPEALIPLLSRSSRVRTAYDVTLAQLDAAFAPDAVYVGLYETMFRPETIARLSHFAGVDFRPEFSETRVNGSPDTPDLDPACRRAVAQAYAGVYEAVARRFPEVEAVWPGFRLL